MNIVEAIKQATRAVVGPYFLLPIRGQDKPIKRERVYCYELFHQLRLTLGESHLTLSGEPDKHGHQDFPHLSPDFILHIPGQNTANTAAIEVECRVDREHLFKDLRNLKIMQGNGYRTLVLLLFANTDVPWPKLKRASERAGIRLEDITVLLHKTAGVAATQQTPPPST